MGQKVNPHGLRVGIIKDWDAKWYAEKDFADNLVEDVKIRKFIKNKLYAAGVSKITIERTAGRVKVNVHTAKPGIVIGKNGAAIEELKAELQKMTAGKVAVNIEEIKRPELDAQLVAENIALQLENRVTFRRAMKQAMGRTMKFGAKGIKTMVSGRLGGADIARGESLSYATTFPSLYGSDIIFFRNNAKSSSASYFSSSITILSPATARCNKESTNIISWFFAFFFASSP